MNNLPPSFAIINEIDYDAKGLTLDVIDTFLESVASSGDPDLLFEAMGLDELDDGYRAGASPLDEVMLEAITTKRNRVERTMAAFKKALSASMTGTNIEVGSATLGKPQKSGIVATMTARFPFSDGQTLSIVFHAPDKDPMVINQDDTLIAFRFLLNKADVTNVVAPHNGRDISLKQTTMAVANLVERNSEKFKQRQADLIARKEEVDKLEESLEAESDKQAAIAEEIDQAKETLSELNDRSEHYTGVESRKVQRIAELKAQIEAYKSASKTGQTVDKDMVDRINDLSAIDQLQGREKAKAISKAVKAEFKRIGVTVSAKLQTQKVPILDVRVKEGTPPIPQKTVDLLNSIGSGEATSMYTYIFSVSEWERALRMGFKGAESESTKVAALPQQLEALVAEYEKSTGWSADSEPQKEVRHALATQSWEKFADENNDIAEELFSRLILSIRNKLFAQGAEYVTGGNQFNSPSWPLMFESVPINMQSDTAYLEAGHWSSYKLLVGESKTAFPFTPSDEVNELISKVIAEARKQAAEKAIEETPDHNEDGTRDTAETKPTGLNVGDKFTVDGMEYQLTEVPESPDKYITASGGPMGALGGEQWSSYEAFKRSTGMTIAKFEQGEPASFTTNLPEWSKSIVQKRIDDFQYDLKDVAGIEEAIYKLVETGGPVPELEEISKGRSLHFDDVIFGEAGVLSLIRHDLRKVFISALVDDYGWYWKDGSDDILVKDDFQFVFYDVGAISLKATISAKAGNELVRVELSYNKPIARQLKSIEKAYSEAISKDKSIQSELSWLDWESALIDAIADKYDMTVGDVQGMLDMAHVQKLANGLWSSKTSVDEAVDKVWKLASPSEEESEPEPSAKVGSEYFDYSAEGSEAVKLADYRRATKRLEYAIDRLTGGMPDEFVAQPVKESLIEVANDLIVLRSPRAKEDDVKWRDFFIQKAYETIQRWEKAKADAKAKESEKLVGLYDELEALAIKLDIGYNGLGNEGAVEYVFEGSIGEEWGIESDDVSGLQDGRGASFEVILHGERGSNVVSKFAVASVNELGPEIIRQAQKRDSYSALAQKDMNDSKEPENGSEVEESNGESPEVTDALATLTRLTDGGVQDTDEFDRLLDEAANTLEQAGLMDRYDAELNAAADVLTTLLMREAEGL